MKKYLILILAIVLVAITLWKTRDIPLESPVYASLGDSLTINTFNKLSSALQGAIARGGFAEAVSFCKIEAGSLTQTYGDTYTKINRTALKVRNRQNEPDSLERTQLLHFQSLISAGALAIPQMIEEKNGTVHYFKPILLQPLCLGCHGNPGIEILDSTLLAIQKNYPDDEAVGFKVGDLRGAWHITFTPGNEKK